MKLHNMSGTLEEAAKIISTMSEQERSKFYDELFKYEPSRPCTVRDSANRVENQSPVR